MLDSYLDHLQEAIKPTKWRIRVEVYILKEDKIILGFKEKLKIYIPCGGGVEEGQTLKKAAEIEALEELGIQIKDISLIVSNPYKVDYSETLKNDNSEKARERLRMFKGIKTYFMKATFVKFDKKYYNREHDAMKPVIMTKDKALKEFKKNPVSINRMREKIIRMI